MALYMWMASYTPEAVRSIVESGSDREEVARGAVEAAGGKLLGFYGLIGQKYHIALICEVPGAGEFIGLVLGTTLGGAIASWKTIPMYGKEERETAFEVCKTVQGVYKPPS